jgi:hypothetical protein
MTLTKRAFWCQTTIFYHTGGAKKMYAGRTKYIGVLQVAFKILFPYS